MYERESNWRVMRPPALLGDGRGLWRGRLLLGSISAVLSHDWLRWCGVTHALGALGKFDKDLNIIHEYKVVHDARYVGIYYANWPINNHKHRARHQAVFDAIDQVLASSDGCLLVYCRNGQDRSVFLCYAYLRLWHKMGHTTAMQVLASRCDCHYKPLFYYDRQNEDNREWLDQLLTQGPWQGPCSLEEVMEWESGELEPPRVWNY